MDKIIDAWYDEDSGLSQVTLGTHWGTFTRTVVVDPEDADVANRWDGCKFAHNHTATVIARAMYANGVPRIENNKEFNKVLGMMRDQAYYAERDGRKYLQVAEEMRQRYPEFIEETLESRRNFGKKEK